MPDRYFKVIRILFCNFCVSSTVADKVSSFLYFDLFVNELSNGSFWVCIYSAVC